MMWTSAIESVTAFVSDLALAGLEMSIIAAAFFVLYLVVTGCISK